MHFPILRRSDDEYAARTKHAGAFRDDGVRSANVLDHLRAQDGVERAVFEGQRVRTAVHISYRVRGVVKAHPFPHCAPNRSIWFFATTHVEEPAGSVCRERSLNIAR